MTTTHTHTNRRAPVRRFDRQAPRPRRQCLPDSGFRPSTHRRPYRDDGSRTPPAGDALFPKRR